MPNQFLSDEFGDIEDYFVTDYWLIDNFVGDSLWTWGTGDNGRLGTNNTTQQIVPVTTFAGGTTWKQVSCGNFITAAIKTDGSLWSWGFNYNGPLGDNTTITRSIPVTTFAGGNDWKQVSGGRFHTAAIKTDGSLWTWGNNDNGRLGTNGGGSKSTPVTTFAGGTNWKSVSCGGYHTAAIKTDGTLWVWGAGNNGRLGTNNTDNKNVPVTTFAGGTTWKQVSCGFQHTAAIKTDGTLWVWGAGSGLGDNTTTQRNTPVTTFAGETNWKQVSAGNHTAAIKTDGSLWTWGAGNDGRLGTNNTTTRSTPVTTFAGGNNWKSVACGNEYTAAIKTDGTLWTWGAGGKLGDNTTTSRSTPVTTFAGGNNWKQFSGGENHVAAIKSGLNVDLS
jgi:alpha-tubulin suppressor-like RCC1 family protein